MKDYKDISRIAIKMIIAKNKIISPMVDALRHHELTECQYRVLTSINEAGTARLSELASNAAIIRESLSRIIPTLKSRKLVDVQRNEGDKRAYLISLTPRGKRLLMSANETLEKLSFIDVSNSLEKQLDAIAGAKHAH